MSLLLAALLRHVGALVPDNDGTKMAVDLRPSAEAPIPQHSTEVDRKPVARKKQVGQPLRNTTAIATQPINDLRFMATRTGLPVDLTPDTLWVPRPHEGAATLLLKPSKPSRRFGFIKFVRKVRQRNVESESELIRQNVDTAASQSWNVRFFLGLVLMGGAVHLLCNQMLVEGKQEVEDDMDAVYGRPCWVWFCAAIIFVFSSMVFWMTAVSVNMVNNEIENASQPQDAGDGVSVTRYPIDKPGKRALEAGLGVAMSAAVASILTFSWRWRGQDKIRASLLAQFALRGATLSGCIAMLLEYLGEVLIDATGQSTTGFSLGNAMMMLIVGASEEGAKLAAVIVGTWISLAALREADESVGCCSRCWRELVPTRRGLMLAGLAAGFGFMTMENSEYMIAVACTPPMKYTMADGDEDAVTGAVLNLQVFVTLFVRIFLNIHPWLTALSAGRVARFVFTEGRGLACLSCSEFIWAIYPSACAHALFDYLVGGGGPAILGLLAVPSVWMGARWGFQAEWAAVDEPSANVDDDKINKVEG